MHQRVFKQKGSRVYRLRYRLGNDPRIHDVPLHTANKEVAEAKAAEIVLDAEKALHGVGVPRSLRIAQQRTFKEHIEDYVGDLRARNRSASHIKHVKCRLILLAEACRWRYLGDASADRFLNWRADHPELSQKTRNEYLGHGSAFFNWLMRQERITANPLRCVFKMETKGNETFKRRSLTFEEVAKLVAGSKRRGFVYLVAIGTGLRRNELKQLKWPDLLLDTPRPFVQLRAETTKAKRADVIPVVPILAELLRAAKLKARHCSGLVFPRGILRPKTLAKDLKACGIPVEDARGFRVDFHALRHTYTSLMGNAGVSELARMKLARHRSWKMTDRYTDPQCLPLFEEMKKFGDALASSLASHNFGKTGPKQGSAVQSAAETMAPANYANADSEAVLVDAGGTAESESWRRGGDSNPR